MTQDREQFVDSNMPTFLKDAMGAWASEHNVSLAEAGRQAWAAFLDIDYEASRRTRTPKYDSPEEAKRAQYDRAALLRWGRAIGGRLLAKGEIEAATLIARAVEEHDYETLATLKTAMEDSTDDAE